MNPQLLEAYKQDPRYVAELDRIAATYSPDEEGYVRLEVISAGELSSTAQYTGRYITGAEDTPILAEGLDIAGDPDQFTRVRIKVEDVPVLLDRIAAHKERQIAKALGQASL